MRHIGPFLQEEARGGGIVHVVLLLVVVTNENKVNSYSDQLKLGQVCKFRVEFDKKRIKTKIMATYIDAS